MKSRCCKLASYQVYYWLRVDEAIITDILLQDNGWIVDNEDEEVRPLWFTGTFSFLDFHGSQQI